MKSATARMPPSIGLTIILLCAEMQNFDHSMKIHQHLIKVRGEVQTDIKTAVVKSKLSEKEAFQNNESVLKIWFHLVNS